MRPDLTGSYVVDVVHPEDVPSHWPGCPFSAVILPAGCDLDRAVQRTGLTGIEIVGDHWQSRNGKAVSFCRREYLPAFIHSSSQARLSEFLATFRGDPAVEVCVLAGDQDVLH